MKATDKHGAAALVVLLVAVVLSAAGLWVVKPKALHGETRRAEASTVATERLEQANNKQGAEAAASVTKIGEAAATAPESPEKTFITREVPVALAKLPAPDPQALIEAEKRKTAVMEGRLVEASKLYDSALKRASTLEKERDAALTARRKADADLNETAAAHRAAEQQRNAFILVASVCAALYGYTKLTHFSPGALAEVVTDVKNGVHPITAIDTVASRLQQRMVNFLAKIKS
jgi:hypothetical protein